MLFRLKNVKVGSIFHIEALTVPVSTVTCIVGESGSGKTTLLKLLNGMISPDCGEIYYDGRPLQEWEPVELRRNVVMAPQTPAIFKGSIKDNLLAGLRFSEKPPVSDERAREALRTVQLDKALHDDAESLSGGEKQRLALARIALMKPPVWLLDEPTSALDDDTSFDVLTNLVRSIKKEKQTLVMVTHSKAAVRSFAENVVEIPGNRKKRGVINE